jgi:hypothetical protein
MLVNRTALGVTVTAGLLAALLPATAAAQSGRNRPQVSSPTRVATPIDPAVQAQTQLALSEGNVASNRGAAIENLVSTWGGQLGSAAAAEQFRMTLNLKSNRTLAQLQSATSLDGVRAVLLGKADGSLTGGSIAPMNLGDTSNDLTYTPVNPPCRIVDTRNYGGGAPRAAGFIGNYQVYGSAATMGAQGGNNVTGCPAPKGEPVGVAANFTAIPSATGHLRVYPFGGGLPTVSFLNFTTGVNIANAGIVSTGYLLAADLVIHNFATTHHVADVMGYFYPVSQSDPALNQVKDAAYVATGAVSNPIPSDSVLRIGPFTTHTTAAGDVVHITAAQVFGTTTAWGWASALDVYPCYRASPAGALITLGGGMFNLGVEAVLVNQRTQFTVTGVVTPGAGTFNFGMCYRTSDVAWDNNEWGYTSTTVLNPLP